MISSISSKKDIEWKIWALSRLGARELLYGSADRVIPPLEADIWAEKLMKSAHAERKVIASAVARICAKTGDRVRDISPEVAGKVIEWLKVDASTSSFSSGLENVLHMEEKDRDEVFGETLPPGLFLAG